MFFSEDNVAERKINIAVQENYFASEFIYFGKYSQVPFEKVFDVSSFLIM